MDVPQLFISRRVQGYMTTFLKRKMKSRKKFQKNILGETNPVRLLSYMLSEVNGVAVLYYVTINLLVVDGVM